MIGPLVALTVCDFTATWGPTSWPGCLSCLSRVENTHWGILAVWSTHSRQGRLACELYISCFLHWVLWHAVFTDIYWSFSVHLSVIAWAYAIVTERNSYSSHWYGFHMKQTMSPDKPLEWKHESLIMWKWEEVEGSFIRCRQCTWCLPQIHCCVFEIGSW